MKPRYFYHWIIGVPVNMLVVIFLVKAAWEGNDKAIILVTIGYPILIAVNAIVWIVLHVLRKPQAEVYKTIVLCLFILFLPVLFISALQ